MKAVEVTQPGEPELLRVTERPIPELGRDEVLIKVRAAGVNRVALRQGAYPTPKGASDLPGLEVSGEIVDGDLSGSNFKKGDLVCALTPGGGYAEYVKVPVGHCLPIPKGLSEVEPLVSPKTTLPSGLTFLSVAHSSQAKACLCMVAETLQREVWPLFESGKIKPLIYKTFDYKDAAKAHELIESSGHIGKVILTF